MNAPSPVTVVFGEHSVPFSGSVQPALAPASTLAIGPAVARSAQTVTSCVILIVAVAILVVIAILLLEGPDPARLATIIRMVPSLCGAQLAQAMFAPSFPGNQNPVRQV